MSDNERTPLGTARINSERFDTELAAVWFAANYYYESSFKRGCEYIGVVFQESNRKFGVTVSDLYRGFGGSKVLVRDVPRGTNPMAVWHTHIPCFAGSVSKDAQVLRCVLTSFDLGWDEFSGADTDITHVQSKISKRPIPIYLITATTIKRYTGPRGDQLKVWSKEAPSRMRSR